MKIIAKTDKGRIRPTNQDAYTAGEMPDGAVWVAVCDGMGGASGGDVASSLAVKLITERINTLYRTGMSAPSVKSMLSSAISKANIGVYDVARANSELEGMGTTVVVAVIIGTVVYIAHAGDSRGYLINPQDGTIEQLTKDHSVVQQMIDDGKITEDDALSYPGRNIITRALGVDEELQTDFCEHEFPEGSRLLLCTDGLTNSISDDEIKDVVLNSPEGETADILVEKAIKYGGHDNITVVTVG